MLRSRAAAVVGGTAVGVDDDLAAGQAAVTVRAADNKAAGRVDQVAGVGGEEILRQHRLDDLLDHRFGQLRVRNVRAVLVETTTVSIATGLPSTYFTVSCDLASGRSQGRRAVAAHFGLALHDAVRVVDRERHQRFGFAAGVAEHQALVAGALVEIQALAFVHALRAMSGDWRLIAVRMAQDVVVEADVGVGVADAAMVSCAISR